MCFVAIVAVALLGLVIVARQSSLTTRTATLYDTSGKPVRQWEFTSFLNVNAAAASFTDTNGKAVIISGTFVIEEK